MRRIKINQKKLMEENVPLILEPPMNLATASYTLEKRKWSEDPENYKFEILLRHDDKDLLRTMGDVLGRAVRRHVHYS